VHHANDQCVPGQQDFKLDLSMETLAALVGLGE
jgi:hypothetical protein